MESLRRHETGIAIRTPGVKKKNASKVVQAQTDGALVNVAVDVPLFVNVITDHKVRFRHASITGNHTAEIIAHE